MARFFQGTETKIMETDRELWKLTVAARDTAVEVVLKAHDPSDSLRELRSSNDDTVHGVAARARRVPERVWLADRGHV